MIPSHCSIFCISLMVFITTFQEDLKAVCAVTVESQVAGLKECHLHFFHSQFLPWCVFLKTLDSIVCSHAHPASLYLSPFSLLGVDIRRGGAKKSCWIMCQSWKRAQISPHYHSLWDNSARGFICPQGERKRISNLCHLIWRLRPYPAKFCFSKPPT